MWLDTPLARAQANLVERLLGTTTAHRTLATTLGARFVELS